MQLFNCQNCNEKDKPRMVSCILFVFTTADMYSLCFGKRHHHENRIFCTLLIQMHLRSQQRPDLQSFLSFPLRDTFRRGGLSAPHISPNRFFSSFSLPQTVMDTLRQQWVVGETGENLRRNAIKNFWPQAASPKKAQRTIVRPKKKERRDQTADGKKEVAKRKRESERER